MHYLIYLHNDHMKNFSTELSTRYNYSTAQWTEVHLRYEPFTTKMCTSIECPVASSIVLEASTVAFQK